MLLALDLGTTTGYAIKDIKSSTILSGSWSFKGSRFEGGGMRFMRFRHRLHETQKAGPLTAVYYEEVRRHAGTDAAHVYGGLLAILSEFCEDKCVPYRGVGVGTIKRSWTGKGNASKDDMIRVAVEHGYSPIDDNEADAIALLHYAAQEHGL
jgi:Holliday junction resolvasome RuvABC endonuclease subunit